MGLDLSEEQQKQFGFDPATLAKATGDVKKKKDDAERAYNEAAARAKTAAAARTQDNATVGPVRFRIAQGSRLISGKVSQNVRSGLLIVSGDDEWKKFVDIEIAAGRTPKLENYPNDKQPAGSVFVGRCLLEGHPQKESIADGDVITVMGYPAGTHSYTSVEQAARTVKKFSASLETVVDRELKRVP